MRKIHIKKSLSQQHKSTVTVVGAGLAAAFLAVVLAKRGYKVNVYERYSEQDTLDNSSRRSFNITFYGYGVVALKEAGIWDEVEPILLKLNGSATQVTPTGSYIYAHFEKGDMPYYAVSRAALLKTLVGAARRNALVTFHFETPITAIDRDTKTITIKDPKTGRSKTLKTDVLIGADGVNSTVCASLQAGQHSDHSKETADWTYRQVAFSSEIVKTLGMKPEMAYSWTRKNASLIGFPQLDGVFGALLMLPKSSELGFESMKTPVDVEKLVTRQFPLLLPALETITEAILNNPDGNFVAVNTSPWFYEDFIAIIGDAAHGFFPFYGMGAATAFGDCMKLVHLLDTYGPKWGTIFPLYQEARKKNTDVIGELSRQTLARFTRSTKADRGAIYDRLETLLSNWFPKLFLPSMFYSVAHEPNRSAEYKVAHDKQRNRNKYIGIGLAVSAITAIFAILERLQSARRR